MQSCFYEGEVVHRRTHPVSHQFRYRVAMFYLDLDEIESLENDRLLSTQPHHWNGFVAGDHLALRPGDSSTTTCETLADRVRHLVVEQTGMRLAGPVRLLTQLRRLGFYFSPLNLYFCFDAAGEDLQAIVAEVSNTPWREQHLYVLWAGNGDGDYGAGQRRYSHAKQFHVSPFMSMQFDYAWAISPPGEALSVAIGNRAADGTTPFTATMQLSRRPLDRSNLRRLWLRYPWLTAQIFAAIYWQALKLWWKKCPYHPHPNRSPAPAAMK